MTTSAENPFCSGPPLCAERFAFLSEFANTFVEFGKEKCEEKRFSFGESKSLSSCSAAGQKISVAVGRGGREVFDHSGIFPQIAENLVPEQRIHRRRPRPLVWPLRQSSPPGSVGKEGGRMKYGLD